MSLHNASSLKQMGAALLLSLLAMLSACASTPAPSASATIPPGDALQVREGIRVVYGVGADKSRDGVGEGLFFVNRLLENYERAQIPKAQRAVVVVLYNAAAYWLLNDQAWQAYQGPRQLNQEANPNVALIQSLIARGVRVEVCATTLKKKGWTPQDLLPGVHVVPGAYARLVDLQLLGFAYVAFD